MVKLFTSDGKFSALKVGTQLVVLLGLVLGLVAFVGNNKTVTLNVDGKVSSIQTFGGTVGQVVQSADVELQPADRVSPAADVSVQNGQVINVNLAKVVTVNLDGSKRTVNTTSPDVGGLVSELGVASSSEVSVPAESQLTVQGSFVSISTPKNITLVADGASNAITTTSSSVGDVLDDAGIVLGANDRASQPANAPVVNNMVVKVSRVDTSQSAATTEDIPFETLKTDDPELLVGEEKVTQEGAAGKVDKKFSLVLVDGREASRTLVSETVTLEPVTKKISVGTKPKPKPAAAKPAAGTNTGAAAPAMMNEAMWDAIAMCESTGNWSINTGNGYYGGLQFDIQTWLGAGGGAYAPNASLATKAQQIDIANRVYAQRGLQPWGCGWAAGG
ncbi:ubiquitin-like domain-containing protein [Pseudarthrobacter sp. J75]|uniref:ubiquitin-like domain-containing protein n=1 Tax=unclassified Pseudarthrobacter TaxID=2647000 RepID=UPI002E812E28|nr:MULTISPECIES: ubiquitin-like domain-containing protein [unclassified Pseudarthrobacter]MEE2521652.1 ubiquitin-like domain-containing protein [Pseudarthrobacter sp. J47]MEE2527729.1 ubiquitin-like domain-containing protein [Pseudarthrobacter sp. J75]